MTEFRVASDKASEQLRDRRIWLIVWGVFLALLGITWFAVSGANSASRQVNIALACLAGLLVVSVVAVAHFLNLRQGLETMKRG